jgi:hypothetical protein
VQTQHQINGSGVFMAKEYDFKIGDAVSVPQSERTGRIILIETKRQQNGYNNGDIITEYTVEVPFMNIRDTSSKYYSAKLGGLEHVMRENERLVEALYKEESLKIKAAKK